MASILNVDQINNAAGTSAVTIDASTGKASFPNGVTLPAGAGGKVLQAVNVTANAVTISAASPTTIVTTNITTQANSKLYIAFSSDLNSDTAGAWKFNQVFLDNVLQTGNISSTATASFQSCVSLVHLSSAVTAGTHTVKITGHSGGGTSTYAENGNNGNSLVVMEIAQ